MMNPEQENKTDERLPFFRTWKGLYAFVIGFLVFLVLVFYVLTKAYNFQN